MLHFLAIRVARAIVAMFLVLVIALLTVRFSGTPFERMYPEGLTPQLQAALEAKYGLDLPLPTQFRVYLGQLAQGDFGRSLHSGEKVLNIYAARMPYTLAIGGMALVTAVGIGIPLGAAAALWRRHAGTRLGMSAAFLGYAIPHFVIAIGLILLFGYHWRALPTVGLDTWRHYILPVAALSIPMIAGLARFMRASMLDAINNPPAFLPMCSRQLTVSARAERCHVFDGKGRRLAPFADPGAAAGPGVPATLPTPKKG